MSVQLSYVHSMHQESAMTENVICVIKLVLLAKFHGDYAKQLHILRRAEFGRTDIVEKEKVANFAETPEHFAELCF